MRKLKRITLSILVLFIIGGCFNIVKAQDSPATSKGFNPGDGFKQINFGVEVEGFGIPIYLGMDFGVSEMITIGPRVSFQTRSQEFGPNNELKSSSTMIIPSFKGDYHYSGHIAGLPSELDLYGGLSLGLALWNSNVESYNLNGDIVESNNSYSDIKLWMQLGARYYFSDKWGVQVEFVSFGNNGSVGLSYKL